MSFIFLPAILQAATIWSEDFTGDDGDGLIGPSPASTFDGGNWTNYLGTATLSANTDWFRVVSGQMEGRDIDGEPIWRSEPIDISSYDPVSISIDVSESGDMESSDEIGSYYILDGGSETLIDEDTDDFTSAVHTVSGLSGTTLVIVVRMNNGAATEYHRFDNILVEGTLVSSGPDDPSAFTATKDGVNNTTEIDLAWIDNAAGDAVLMAWNTTDTFGNPTGSYSVGDPITGGGTVLQNNSTESYTHSGLIPGAIYYYKIWSVNGSDYSTGLTANETLDCFTNGPTGLSANPTNQIDFTANWTAVPGALEYQLDVSTNNTFSASSSGNDDFTDGDFTSSPAWSGDTGSFSIQTAGTLVSGSATTDSSYLGSDSSIGDIALVTPSTEVSEWKFSLGSPTFNPSGANFFGVILMSDAVLSGDIQATSWNGYYLKLGENGSGDQIDLVRRSGSSSTTVGTFSTDTFDTGALNDGLDIRITRDGSGQFEMFTATGFQYSSTPTTSEGTLSDNTHTSSSYFGVYQAFGSPSASRRVYIDNIAFGIVSSGEDYIPAYSNRVVAGTSQSVTGLTAETEYFYRVRAVGANPCISDNSATGSVTTLAIPVPEVDILGTNGVEIADGDVTPDIADGTDFGSVDISSGTQVHTFAVTNSGTATLTLSGVSTSGTHAADFEVTSAPAGTLAAGASTTLEITFDPSAFGTRTATFTLNSDDADEGVYTFDVQGQGSITLAEAVDNDTLIFTTSGDADWFGQSIEFNVDGEAAQSGAIGDNQSSILETTVTGPGTLMFDWKVDSEEDFDNLHFIISGTTVATNTGDIDWSSTNFAIPAGTQTVQWEYEKNVSNTNGADAAWVDNVLFVIPADETGPLFSNFGLNSAGNTSIDDGTFTGSFDLLIDMNDTTSGIRWTSSGPTYSITNPSGGRAVAPTAFTTTSHLDAKNSTTATGAVTGLTFEEGTWTVEVIAEDMGGFASTNQFTFDLTDDDPAGPEHSLFTIGGVGGEGDTNLLPGAVAIVAVNGASTNDTGDKLTTESFISFVVLSPFPEGTVIEFTDTGWDPDADDWHRPTEIHTNTFIAAGPGDVGQVFSLALEEINNNGDQIAAYQYSGIDAPIDDPDNVSFVFAVNLDPGTNGWFTGTIPNNNESSGLYRRLTNGATAVTLPFNGMVNVIYTGTLSGTASDLLSSISDSNNWQVLAQPITMDISGLDFDITGAGDIVWSTAILTDAQLLDGGYVVSNRIQDAQSGVSTVPAPYFKIENTQGTLVVSNAFTVTYTDGETGFIDQDLTAGAGTFSAIELGVMTGSVTAVDNDNDRANDGAEGPVILRFNVVDDDPNAPVMGELSSSDFSPISLSALSAGDIAILGFHADGTDDFSFMTFVAIAESTVINFTDEGIANGVLPGTDEGVIEWTAPLGGLAAGTVVVITEPNTSINIAADTGSAVENGTYEFAGNGDQLIAFQSDASSTTFLFAINTDSTGWDNSTDNSKSEVPPGLTEGVDALHMNAGSFASNTADEDNGRYTGTLSGTVSQVKFLIQSGANWEVSQVDVYTLISADATLSDAVATLALTDAELATGGWVVTGEVNDVVSGLDASTLKLDITTPEGNSPAAFTTVNYTNSISSGVTNASLGWSIASLSTGDIELGIHTGEVVSTDMDADRPSDALSSTNRFIFQVVDDDETAPVLATQGTSFNYVTFNGQSAGSEETALTDGDLAGGSITFSTRVYDVVSGFGSANLTLTDPTGTDALTGATFDTEPASGATGNQFSPLSTRLVKTGIDLTSQIELGIWTARVEVVDADADRTADGETNQTSYLMVVVDDDTQGPLTSNLTVNSLSATSFDTGFEGIEGWTTHGGTNWTETVNGNDWIATSVFLVSFGGRGGAGNYVGLNGVGDTFQMPDADQAGYLSFFARLTSDPSGAGSSLVIEKNDGGWTTVDTVIVDSTDFTHFIIPILDTNSVVSLRVNLSVYDRTVHLDDVALTHYEPWTNSTSLSLSWDASDDSNTGNSGLDDYEFTTINASAPSIAGDGTQTASPATSIDVTGQEGVLTGYVYSVDNDIDRGLSDRAKGREVPYIVRIDQTAPPQISGFGAVEGADPTTEIDLTWTPPADAGGTDLSPWQSYRVYYSDDGDDPTLSDPYFDVDNSNPDLGTRTTGATTLSNFTFGSVYRLNVAGRDDAGNLGALAAAAVEVSLSSFNVTQGVAEVESIATTGIHLSWTATRDQAQQVNRAYDLLYWDASEFSSLSSNQWGLVATVTNSFFQDSGQGSGIDPTTLTDEMRFYRASLKDRWRTNQSTRIASEEIYVLRNVHLCEGQNWVSFPAVPDEATIEFVFGKSLPSSPMIDQATKISWFGRDGNPQATNTIFLQSSTTPSPGSTNWVYTVGGSGIADTTTLPLEQGVVVEIPEGSGDRDIQFIGALPTNTLTQTFPAKAYSLINVNQPAYVHPSDMKLLEAGFTGGPAPIFSDRLWKFDRRSQSVPNIIWYDTDDNTWKFASHGFPSVPDNYFAPDDAIVVHTRRSTSSITYTNELLYPLPTKEMSP